MYSVVALCFVALSGLFFLTAILSPTVIQWTGTPVHSTYRGGIVYYSYRGQNYTLDDPSAATFHETTVWLNPANPSDAMLDNPLDRDIDIASIIGPLLVAAVLLALGLRRRRRLDAAAAGPREEFGQGIDRATMGLLAEQRARIPSRRGDPPA
jgi:hypothetical protein